MNPWNRLRAGYDIQAVLGRLTRIEESLARLEKIASALRRDIDKHADHIMELRAKS